MYQLKGRTALVTGAARRIGRATSLALARAGANVVIHYRESGVEAEELAVQVRTQGVEAATVQAGLENPDEASALLGRAEKLIGPIDVLVNNASVFSKDRLLTFGAEELARNIGTNAFAPLLLSRSLADTSRDGVIVNLLDSKITEYDADHAAYAVSKRMLLTLTKMLAEELAPGIRVSGVAPGLVLPPPGENVGFLERQRSTVPLERYGELDNVTEAVLFLVTNDFITGQIIYVDGGRNLRGSFYG